MKKIRNILFGFMAIAGILSLTPNLALAVDPFEAIDCSDATNASSIICKDKDRELTEYTTSTINIILYVLGALAVVMIIYSGILYIMSGGDSTAVTKAKNTLLYSVIGLIVALLAYAIVNFVVKAFSA